MRAAAAVLGARLRWLKPVREQPTDFWSLPLHTDGANAFIDVQDRRVRVRDFYIDYVLILRHPRSSRWRVDHLRRLSSRKRIREDVPDLYEFLTTVEVERGSGLETCTVEWTRCGWMVMRADPWALSVTRRFSTNITPSAAAHLMSHPQLQANRSRQAQRP